METQDLSPAQQQVIDILGAKADERREFPVDIAEQLEARLHEGLAPYSGQYDPDDALFVSKHRLTRVHGCEAQYLHEQQAPFHWSVPTARGTVAHKAIEFSVHWRDEPLPLVLVDQAMNSLANDQGNLGVWLSGLPEAERAQLRSDVADRVSAFLELFPPLRSQWRPVTESRVKWQAFGGRIIASGKVDLTLGWAGGNGKVLIDLKTGRERQDHREDLRFYALIETLRMGQPPRLGASCYLDRGRFVEEAVTEDSLASAAERFIAGVRLIAELDARERDPRLRPSLGCSWCPLLDGVGDQPPCAAGTDFLTAARNDGAFDDDDVEDIEDF